MQNYGIIFRIQLWFYVDVRKCYSNLHILWISKYIFISVFLSLLSVKNVKEKNIQASLRSIKHGGAISLFNIEKYENLKIYEGWWIF